MWSPVLNSVRAALGRPDPFIDDRVIDGRPVGDACSPNMRIDSGLPLVSTSNANPDSFLLRLVLRVRLTGDGAALDSESLLSASSWRL